MSDISQPWVLFRPSKSKNAKVQSLAKNSSCCCCITNGPGFYWLKITVVYHWSGFRRAVPLLVSLGSFMWLHTAGGSAGLESARWLSSMPGSASVPCMWPLTQLPFLAVSGPCPLRTRISKSPQRFSATLNKSHSKWPVWAGGQSRLKTTVQRGLLHTLWRCVVIKQLIL